LARAGEEAELQEYDASAVGGVEVKEGQGMTMTLPLTKRSRAATQSPVEKGEKEEKQRERS